IAVPPNDVEALTEALIRVAGDADLRQTLTQKGLEYARRFSWQITAERTAAAYRDALAMDNPRQR
ncbi:MAG: glycosyltransferase family 1 protein, partial [Chloroflexota bacterium]|nr:glycosyltransferase family 1 protein [Chloroflexota bacterium]